jgi:NTE family protein
MRPCGSPLTLCGSMKITIVLGAGGPVGHAFHAGLLRGLSHALSWDPRHAELVLGTSAGAQVAALLRAGMSADDLAARAAGAPMSDEGQQIAACYTRPAHAMRWPARFRPASLAYLRRFLERPWRARLGSVLSALLPIGSTSLLPQAEGLRTLFGDAWPERRLWITALCLHSGELCAFGRSGSPATDVGTAVACSGAVPAVCAPVEVEGRMFIDGGMVSSTNLELLHEDDGDLVLVSSPLSVFAPVRLQVRSEVRALRERGKRVVLFEPKGDAARAVGLNPMDLARSAAVVSAAYGSTLLELRSPEVVRALSGAGSPSQHTS